MACMCGGCSQCLADQGWLPEDFEDREDYDEFWDGYDDELKPEEFNPEKYRELLGMADAAYGVGDYLAGQSYANAAQAYMNRTK